MSGEDDEDWGYSGYSKIELRNFINCDDSIYVSNNPYKDRIKKRAYIVDGLIEVNPLIFSTVILKWENHSFRLI